MRIRLGRTFEGEPLELGLPGNFQAHESVHVTFHDPYFAQLLRQVVARHPEVIDALRRLLDMTDPSWTVSRLRDHDVLEEVVSRVRSGQLWLRAPGRRAARATATGIAAAQAESEAPPPPQRRSAMAPTSAPRSTAPSTGAASAEAAASQGPSQAGGGPVGAALLPGGGALAPTAADTITAKDGSAATETPSGPGGQPKGPIDLGTPFKPDKDKTGFIEVELVDVEGTPLAGKPFRIILPDGSRAEGKLNAQGFVRLEGFDPGDCAVIFEKLSPAD